MNGYDVPISIGEAARALFRPTREKTIMSETTKKRPVVLPKKKGRKSSQARRAAKEIGHKCTVVIRVGPGVDSIVHALQTCWESRVSNVYIVDDAYSPSSPIYEEEGTAALLDALRSNQTQLRYNNVLDEKEIQTDILVEMPHDCFMVKGAFSQKIAEVKRDYKSFDVFAVAPQVDLKFSIFNGLIFALFMFDWFRALIHRFKIHQNTHVVFKVVSRRLGNATLPKDGWFSAASRSSYSYGGAGACLRPTKSGLSYFLYLCYSHTHIGIGSFVLFQGAYVLFVGFPFYNWIPFVNEYLQVAGGQVFTSARVVMWVMHGLLSILLVNKYFVSTRDKYAGGSQFQWIHAALIPMWLLPIFPIMLTYGVFLYRGYRAPPPPPSFEFPKFTAGTSEPEQKVSTDQNEEGDSDSE